MDERLPWEIALTKPETQNSKEILPHVLDVSCNFTPIHNFVPKKSMDSSPFIFQQDSDYLNASEYLGDSEEFSRNVGDYDGDTGIFGNMA